MNNVVPPAADIAREFPNQLACIFIRNITADYSDHKNPLLNVERTMEGIPQSKWFVYDSLENLLSLDIQNGTCHPIGKRKSTNLEWWMGRRCWYIYNDATRYEVSRIYDNVVSLSKFIFMQIKTDWPYLQLI